MRLKEFNALVGQDSYVRCQGKVRTDTAIVDTKRAEAHLFSGGTVGWWVRSGYIIVDIDEGKEEALRAIKRLGIKTLMAQTPKGVHMYFKTEKDFAQKIKMVLPIGLKCDFRCANKGYVVLPFGLDDRKFSKHKEIAELPLEFTPIPTRKDSLLGLKDGDGRNATLFSHLMAYKHRGASEEQIEEMAVVINEEIFHKKMNMEELNKIITNVGKYEAQPQGDNPYLLYNSKGVANGVNARAVADYFVNRGDTFVLGGECYAYKEGVYVEASSSVRNTIKEMIAVDHLISNNRIREAYALMIDDTRLQRDSSDLNQDHTLINFKNGVWDVEDKKLIAHDSKYLQTLQIPHEVDYPAKKPWKKTLLYKFLTEKAEMLDEDIEMIMQYMAYCLTLDFGLKTFMILQGKSNTGKSVLIRFFETLVGRHNTSALSMHELNMRFYPAQLYNRLMNTCADNGSLPLSSIENLKKITGGDQIMHEKKGKEPFFFVPHAKLLFSFNQLPLQLEEKSDAFYLRMRILSMERALVLNNEYVNRLCSERSIQEIIPHLLDRLPVTEIPRSARSNVLVEGLRQDSDTVHAFITYSCNTGTRKWVTKKAMYEAYISWCMESGREAHKKHTFIRHMRSRGYTEARHPRSRENCWKGIGLKKKGEE